MAKKENQQSLGDALKAFLKGNSLEEGLDQVRVAEAWAKAMGPGVSGYTREVRLRGSTLHVALNSSVLREELSLGTSRIIDLLNAELGKELVKTLRLQ